MQVKDGIFHYDLSRDMSDVAKFQRQSAEGSVGGATSVRMGETQVRSPALEGNPVQGNVEDSGRVFNLGFSEDTTKYQRPATVRPLSAQGRAAKNSGMLGSLFIPDRRVWEEIYRAGQSVWDRLQIIDGAKAPREAAPISRNPSGAA